MLLSTRKSRRQQEGVGSGPTWQRSPKRPSRRKDGTVVIDMGKDSSSDEEGPTKRAKQATGGAEDLAIHTSKIDLTEHCGEGFYLTKKVRSVKHLAEMFAVDPQDYLRLLRQYATTGGIRS